MLINEDLWIRTTWKNPNIDFLFGADLVEYDMKRAGINLCKQFKLLPEETISSLEQMEKKAADKQLGLMQRADKEFTKKLLKAFELGRQWFIVKNELTEDKVLCTKKDAIFVLNTYVRNTEKDFIRFVPKNTYTSYFTLNKLEFYINTKTRVIDIKGLGQGDELKKVRELHGEFILDFIMKFCELRESMADRRFVVRWLTDILTKYRTHNLPVGYYRELSRDNCYTVWDRNMNKFIHISETEDSPDINIRYNYVNFILPLASIYI